MSAWRATLASRNSSRSSASTVVILELAAHVDDPQRPLGRTHRGTQLDRVTGPGRDVTDIDPPIRDLVRCHPVAETGGDRILLRPGRRHGPVEDEAARW